MQKIEKPWGYEEIWAKTDKYAGKILTILPKQRLSLQYHQKKEETIYVLSGLLRVWTSNDDTDFKDYGPGAVYHVNPGDVHRFGSALLVQTKLLEVSTPELNDVVRLADDYNR